MLDELKRELVHDARIFIDTNILIHFLPALENFFECIEGELDVLRPQIIVPLQVVRELEKHAKNACASTLRQQSLDALEFIEKKRRARSLIVKGEDADGRFSDSVICYVFQKFITKHNLILLTNDQGLGADCLRLNKSRSINRKKRVSVYGISKAGKFYRFSDEPLKKKKKTVSDAGRPSAHKAAFSIADTVEMGLGNQLSVSKIPDQGNYVFSEKGHRFLLGDEIARGGEGCIYKIDGNPNLVAKVYFRDKLLRLQKEKIARMVKSKISVANVCWPRESLWNEKKEFVGYIMPLAKGFPLARSVCHPMLLKKKFPHWMKKDLVQLCLTILSGIEKLHAENILLGDINEENVLVDSPKNVYFIDVDSYQIEGLPCPVGTQLFSPPEVLLENAKWKRQKGTERKFSSFLRTKEQERYSIAMLLFRILVPGKSPYAQVGGDDVARNIIEMNFPYPCGEHRSENVPPGKWRYIWSHLPREVKEAFWGTFHKEGINSSPKKRLSVSEWKKLLSKYLHLLEEGRLQKNDAMSNDLFPDRLKRIAGVNYKKCSICGKEFDSKIIRDGLCPSCYHTPAETRKCKYCGTSFDISVGKKLFFEAHAKELPTLCPDCRKKIAETRKCKYCGTSFDISVKEKLFFEAHAKELPTLCPDCRKKIAGTYACVDCGCVFSILLGEELFFKEKGWSRPVRCPDCRRKRKAP